MVTILSNATLVTGDRGRTVLYDSALAVQHSVIAALGPTQDILAQFPEGEVVDCRGKAVFPAWSTAILTCWRRQTGVSLKTSAFLRR